MISVKVKKYCSGDITKIQNYDNALNDPHQVWYVFHRNRLTGVGMIPRSILKGLGKYYNCRPEELVFLKKDEIDRLPELIGNTRHHGSSCRLVFKFWTQLHPDELFLNITGDQFNELHGSILRLRILYHQMKARCYNPSAQDYPNYGQRGIRMCRDWL